MLTGEKADLSLVELTEAQTFIESGQRLGRSSRL